VCWPSPASTLDRGERRPSRLVAAPQGNSLVACINQTDMQGRP
jgi:hypothetical protein